jgi:hypothetical protein
MMLALAQSFRDDSGPLICEKIINSNTILGGPSATGNQNQDQDVSVVAFTSNSPIQPALALLRSQRKY